jgi:hypothetical protein
MLQMLDGEGRYVPINFQMANTAPCAAGPERVLTKVAGTRVKVDTVPIERERGEVEVTVTEAACRYEALD